MQEYLVCYTRFAFIACLIVSITSCGGGNAEALAPVQVIPPLTPPLAQTPTPPTPAPPELKLAFQVDQTRNNQGLAYANGYFYVSYDLGGGKGYIERYTKDGILDPNFGRTAVPTRHSAELAYRESDGRIYSVSGGGSEPTYVFRLSADGKSVDKTYDFLEYGNSGLLAIDNTRDLLVLLTTKQGGDAGSVTFRLIDWNAGNKVLSEFTLPSLGTPQGVEIVDGTFYYYTNNKITVIDAIGNIIDEWQIKASGESEGIALIINGAERYLAIGYNSPQRIYTIRPIILGNNAAVGAHYVIGETTK